MVIRFEAEQSVRKDIFLNKILEIWYNGLKESPKAQKRMQTFRGW